MDDLVQRIAGRDRAWVTAIAVRRAAERLRVLDGRPPLFEVPPPLLSGTAAANAIAAGVACRSGLHNTLPARAA